MVVGIVCTGIGAFVPFREHKQKANGKAPFLLRFSIELSKRQNYKW
jgi:hypothetical protein